MRLVEHTSTRLIIVASAVFLWVLSGIVSLGIITLIIVMWVSAEFQAGQEVIGLSLLFSLFLLKFLFGFRTPTIIATFDKTSASMRIEQKWLWKQQAVDFPIASIKTINVIRKGSFGKARQYFKIWLEFHSGENLPLTPENYRLQKFVEHRANEIREFLNLIHQGSQEI